MQTLLRVLILLAAASAAWGQCGPNATRKPIGGGQYSCVPNADSMTFTPVAVADLGTCNAGAKGTRRTANNANAPALGVAVAGGGAAWASVECDGANWIVTGKTGAAAGTGDVVGPASNTDNYIPQWNGADSKTLKNGMAIGTGAGTIAAGDHGHTGLTGTSSVCFGLDTGDTPAGAKVCGDGAGGFVVKDASDNVLFTVDVNGVASFGDGTDPWNLTGLTDDAPPAAPGSANQFTSFFDRTTGLPSWILTGGTQKYAALGDTNGAATLAPAEAYDATNWDNDTAPPQKDAVRDKIETLAPKADPVFTSSMQVPNGASPTVDAAGEVAVDTTTDQLQFYGGAKRALPSIQHLSFVIIAPVDTDDFFIMKAPYAMTILGIDGIVGAATNVVGQLQECATDGTSCTDLDSDITFDTDGAADDGSLTDSAIASGAWLKWKTTSVSGTPGSLTVTIRYRVVPD